MVWLDLVFADSALPTGSFIYSSGLEAAVQIGLVRSMEDLQDFLDFTVESNAYSSLVYIKHLQDIISNKPENALQQIIEADLHCDSLITNHVAKRSSVSQGASFLALLGRSFPLDSTVLSEYRIAVKQKKSPGHACIVFGLMTAEFNISDPLRLFVFSLVRSITSAAVRLNVLGPYAATRLLYENRSRYESQLEFVHGDLDRVHSCSPVLDVVQGVHDKLYSRLFNS